VLSDPDLCERMGRRSLAIIAGWSFREDIAGLKRALDHFTGSRARDR
jgi:hypothetical protein